MESFRDKLQEYVIKSREFYLRKWCWHVRYLDNVIQGHNNNCNVIRRIKLYKLFTSVLHKCYFSNYFKVSIFFLYSVYQNTERLYIRQKVNKQSERLILSVSLNTHTYITLISDLFRSHLLALIQLKGWPQKKNLSDTSKRQHSTVIL